MHILVPTDGSPHAQLALEEAAELAVALGARVTILTVSQGVRLEPSAILATPAYPPGHYGGEGDYLSPSKAEAWAILEAAAGVFFRRELSPGMEYRVGDPATAILDGAEAWDVDLIVMGARGRSAIARFLLGSVADRVIHHAPCSVLIARGRQPKA
jgi:nucleotide-binding universal stress UspA family protein